MGMAVPGTAVIIFWNLPGIEWTANLVFGVIRFDWMQLLRRALVVRGAGVQQESIQ
jgi:hypothetical protein